MRVSILGVRYEIDQSWKIEKFDKASILAFSNGNAGSIRISQKVKRQAFALLESYYGKSKINIFRVFAAGIVLLLDKHKINPELLIVDEEYSGNDDLVAKFIVQYSGGKLSIDQIRKGNIGKKSKAHKTAYRTFKRKITADYSIGEREFTQFLHVTALRNKK